MELRTCKACGDTKPLTSFFFHRRDQIYYGKCKSCYNRRLAPLKREWERRFFRPTNPDGTRGRRVPRTQQPTPPLTPPM